MPSRRAVLGSAGVAATALLAGCDTHPIPAAQLSVAVDAPVEPDGGMTFSLSVRVQIYGESNEDDGIQGLAVLLLSRDGERLGRGAIGDVTHASVPESARSTTESGDGLFSATYYGVDYRTGVDVSATRLPAWITFGYGEATLGAGGPGPHNELTATVRRYRGKRPPPDPVLPGDFAAVEVGGYEYTQVPCGDAAAVLPPRGEPPEPPTGTTATRTGTSPTPTATGGYTTPHAETATDEYDPCGGS